MLNMAQKDIIKICKDLGCCDACCLRYIGLKNPNVYKNPNEYILKYCQPSETVQVPQTDDNDIAEVITNSSPCKNDGPATNHSVSERTEEHNDSLNGDVNDVNSTASSTLVTNVDEKEEKNTEDSRIEDPATEINSESLPPPRKKMKTEGICVCCLGILQSDTWPDSVVMVQDVLEKKGYDSKTFSCALSAPMCTLLREKAVALRIAEDVQDYDPRSLTALKEAWKWSFGVHLSPLVSKELDSGAVSPLQITLTMEYPDDLQELEVLKTISPELFSERSKQKRRFTVEFTRRSVEQALEDCAPAALRAAGGLRPAAGVARCVSVAAAAQPAYLGGRYIKLSRSLPQTPWLVNGERVMQSSVQEIIFGPVAAACRIPEGEVEWRLKFIAAGREDVDVRCLGDGRPFAIEISDPRRQLTEEELRQVCEEISRDGRIMVHMMAVLTREDLTELKKGEETKCKTYEALCIKLAHSPHDAQVSPPGPVAVTARDLAAVAAYRNTPPDAAAPWLLTQRTPIRVLHRRPLLTRTRYIHEVAAEAVPGQPQLLVVRVRTQAGTYVKEWVHGELGRSGPSLGAALGAPLDLLALDVARVHLAWPPSGRPA